MGVAAKTNLLPKRLRMVDQCDHFLYSGFEMVGQTIAPAFGRRVRGLVGPPGLRVKNRRLFARK